MRLGKHLEIERQRLSIKALGFRVVALVGECLAESSQALRDVGAVLARSPAVDGKRFPRQCLAVARVPLPQAHGREPVERSCNVSMCPTEQTATHRERLVVSPPGAV